MVTIKIRSVAVNNKHLCIGDPGTTRTPNILIRSQVLYPVELRDQFAHFARSVAQVQEGDHSIRVMKTEFGSSL